MAENILEKIIKKKNEKIINLKKKISLESLNELINANKMIEIFKGKDNDFSKAVCLNAAAGLIVNEAHQNFADAYNNAREHILSNKVINHLEKIKNG